MNTKQMRQILGLLPPDKCGVCGKTDDTCRFENGCKCWYGKPCK